MRRAVLLLSLLLLALPAMARLGGAPGAWPSTARDLAQIRNSGVLRILVNQSRNSSGEVKGEAIGIEYQRLRAFEHYLNRKAREGGGLTLKIIPTAKDQLLGALQRGEGDLIAPGELLTLRGTREARGISASKAIRRNVPLVLVSRQGNRSYQSVAQLSGRRLALPAGSAVAAALVAVNKQLAQRKLAPIQIEWVDSSLAVEDVLEMVDAGIFALTAVELPIAERWVKVMPKLRIDRHLVLADEGDMSWFVSRDAPKLRASIDSFLKDYRSPSDQDAVFQRVYRGLYKTQNPLGQLERQRLEKVRSVLQRHAEQQDFDWLTLAALAFKESTLNPAAQGSGGATGLMQITPAAARSVGVGNIQNLNNNVLAGAKYLASIRRNFFSSPQIDERERLGFVLAGYNLGPQRVQSLRAEARRRGLDANKWFFQVERIAMEQFGMGVVGYVNSVNKYYLAFDRQRERLEPAVPPLSARK
jgi:membrane-bound lytic murein transglycosylase MltF